ncbi:hypothetical protein [Deinococcus radiophilus]|uniref:hypothetical protein n=1 Tax=Deinococcus radiophilus TaxID=32062 RepID=UPI003622183D
MAVPLTFEEPELDWLGVMLHGMQRDLPAYLRDAGAPVTTLAEIVAFNSEHAEQHSPYGQTLLEMALDPERQVTDEAYEAARTQNFERATGPGQRSRRRGLAALTQQRAVRRLLGGGLPGADGPGRAVQQR